MDLPAVMGLMIEDVAQDLDQGHALGLALHAAIAEEARHLGLVVAVQDADQPLILPDPGGAQLGEIAVELLVEAGDIPLARRQARQPEAVAHQDMVEGAVDGAEEAGPGRLALGVGKLGTGLVNPPIGPGVVLGQLAEIDDVHRPSPWSRCRTIMAETRRPVCCANGAQPRQKGFEASRSTST